MLEGELVGEEACEVALRRALLMHRDDGSARIFGDVYFLERCEFFAFRYTTGMIATEVSVIISIAPRIRLPKFPMRDHSKRFFISDPHLRVVVRDMDHFQTLLRDKLVMLPGLHEIQSTVILEEMKYTAHLPI